VPSKTIKKTFCPTTTDDPASSKELEIQKCPIDDVIRWRDTASKRVSKADARKKQLVKELSFIEKKTISDIKWIRKLNKALNLRVFSQQKNRGDRVKINISKEFVKV
jgi:hypothetical protein